MSKDLVPTENRNEAVVVQNLVAAPITVYRPNAHHQITLEYFGGKHEPFTAKLPGGLEIMQLKEAGMEAIAEQEKGSKKAQFKLGLKKDSLIIKLFFERHVVSGRKSLDSLNQATPKCLNNLAIWIEDNIFSQIPSDTPEDDDE